MRKLTILFSCVLLSALFCNVLTAAEWGNLTGRFVYDGEAPAQTELTLSADKAYCGKFKPLSETLVVGEKGGIKNVLANLYINYRRGEKAPAAHPSYEMDAEAKVVLDNKGCAFAPRVVFVRNSQTLEVKNSDDVGHNTKIDAFNNGSINPLLPAKKKIDHQFKVPEQHAATVSCSIHPWMNAFVIVRDHPYASISDANGEFTIKNLPAGEHTFQFWHEAGYVQDIKYKGKKTRWRAGRTTFTIKGGQTTDLGDIVVAPTLFNKK